MSNLFSSNKYNKFQGNLVFCLQERAPPLYVPSSPLSFKICFLLLLDSLALCAILMATSMKRVGKIRQIVRLKQVMLRWKHMKLRHRTDSSPSSYSGSGRRIPPGFIAVYVGPERKRFVIPTRFLNLPVFVGLLKKAEEEFGFQRTGGLVLPCEVGPFGEMLRLLETDESGFRGLGLEEFLKLVSEIGYESCNEATSSSFRMVTPLIQKARV